MKQPIDWIRATYTGAIAGGVLWAAMVKAMSVFTHGNTSMGFLYTFVSAVSLGVLAAGLALYFRMRETFWRSTAVGIILAPLTGWSLLLFITLTIVVPYHYQWTH